MSDARAYAALSEAADTLRLAQDHVVRAELHTNPRNAMLADFAERIGLLAAEIDGFNRSARSH